MPGCSGLNASAIARRTALAEAGRAEGTLAQLQALVERTERLALSYAARTDASHGADLLQLDRFLRGLDRITTGTAAEIDRARAIADAKAEQAATAERRRAAVEERADAQKQRIARKLADSATPPGTAPRRTWHGS